MKKDWMLAQKEDRYKSTESSSMEIPGATNSLASECEAQIS